MYEIHTAKPSEFTTLSTILRDEGVTAEEVSRRLELESMTEMLTDRVRIALRVSSAGCNDTCDALTRLLVMGKDLDVALVESIVRPGLLGYLTRSGLIRRVEGRYSPAISVSVVDNLYLLSDVLRLPRPGDSWPPHPDFVGPPQASTLAVLNHIDWGAQTEMLFDLGCGTGAIALTAARKGLACTGSDINPRALAYARANAVCNDVDVSFLSAQSTAPATRWPGMPECIVVFNSPAGPRYDRNGWHWPMTLLEAAEIAMSGASHRGYRARKIIVFGLVSYSGAQQSALQAVADQLSNLGLARSSVTPVRDPRFSFRPSDLESNGPPARSILFSSRPELYSFQKYMRDRALDNVDAVFASGEVTDP